MTMETMPMMMVAPSYAKSKADGTVLINLDYQVLMINAQPFVVMVTRLVLKHAMTEITPAVMGKTSYLQPYSCYFNCSKIEKGYECLVPGSLCTAKCGDGYYNNLESCDDGNYANDDGCSKLCKVENHWTCKHNLQGTDYCVTDCGDGYVLGNETCDDSNKTDGDG